MLDTSSNPSAQPSRAALFSHVFLPTYKILIIGDCAVGKSNLLSRYTSNHFDIRTPTTVGVEFCSREVEVPTGRVGETRRVVVQLWDTAGQERCAAISATFFRSAVGVLIVYDVTRRDSLGHVSAWAEYARQYACDDCVFQVIGNKTDLTHLREVSTEEAEEVAHALHMRHFSASALSGDGVSDAFVQIVLAVDAVQSARRSAKAESVGTMWTLPVHKSRMDLRGFGAAEERGKGEMEKGCVC